MSPRAATTEACTPRACTLQREKRLSEEPAHHNEEKPPPARAEKAHAQQRRPRAVKTKINT